MMFVCGMWTSVLLAQFSDSFSDGDFLVNPAWIGTTDSFEVDTLFRLHLNAPANTSESYLSTFSVASVNAEWAFDLLLDFNPSSGNKAKIYLIADHSNLIGDVHGYFVQVGGTDDEISLYRQDGENVHKIIDGRDDVTNHSPVSIRINVQRDMYGTWSLYSDTSVSFAGYEWEGSVFDDTYLNGSYFGVLCDYTATRSDKFWFDHFLVVGEPYVDVFSPTVDTIILRRLNEIDVCFSENITPASAHNITNYWVDGGVGHPATAQLMNDTTVRLTFSPEMPAKTGLSIHVEHIYDVVGNEIVPVDIPFQFSPYYLAWSVVVSEIYPDEEPSRGLPDAEYIELLNRSPDTVVLNDWFLSDYTDTSFFPAERIYPGEYMIVCDEDKVDEFLSYGRVVGLPDFPSLNNSEDVLQLHDQWGRLIDQVTYHKVWYGNQYDEYGIPLSEGGISLEMVNIDNPCAEAENWMPSKASLGGTPGMQNTVFDTAATSPQPEWMQVRVLSEYEIQLIFSEPIHPSTIDDLGNYTIDSYTGTVLSISMEEENHVVLLRLSVPLTPGVLYTISISRLIDCSGNEVGNIQPIDFGLPEIFEPGDVVMNEILFNPLSGGADFIELYNASNKIIDLKDVFIAELDVTNADSILQLTFLADNHIQILPGSFWVFTDNKSQVLSSYYTESPHQIVEVSNFPNFPDDEGSLMIGQSISTPWDQLHYYDDWHFSLLDIQDGVSLERIDIYSPTQNNDNWSSAAKSVGYATPTYINSQQQSVDVSESQIQIHPKIFSPDQDGHKDFTSIFYQLDQAGYVANVAIYDSNGYLTKELVRNETVGMSGSWKWDGTNSFGEKASVGFYIVIVDVFNAKGQLQTIKQTVVLAAKI